MFLCASHFNHWWLHLNLHLNHYLILSYLSEWLIAPYAPLTPSSAGSGVFTIGPLGPWPPLNCKKSHIWQKCNLREVAPIILHVFILYPLSIRKQHNSIALNTVEKRPSSPVIQRCIYLFNIYNLGQCTHCDKMTIFVTSLSPGKNVKWTAE